MASEEQTQTLAYLVNRRRGHMPRLVRCAMRVLSALLLVGSLGTPVAVAQERGSVLDAISDWLSRTSPSDAQGSPGGVTSSHVFQAVQDLTAEIGILRDELGIYDYPPEAELQQDRAPIHAYAKTQEVLRKVLQIQDRLGVPQGEMQHIPFKEISPSDVLVNVQNITAELRKIKAQMIIEREIEPAEMVGAKTPSLVYQSLANASFLLDGLRGRPPTPDDVFLNCSHILDEIELIAAKMGVPLNLDLPAVEGQKRPKDSAQQVLRASYKVITLQTRLGMDASGVPSMTLVRVTPSEVYDMTNMLLAEMSRIKLHLGVNVPYEERAEPRGKTPADGFTLLLVIIRNLDNLIRAASA